MVEGVQQGPVLVVLVGTFFSCSGVFCCGRGLATRMGGSESLPR